jgi:hypothetical protein
VKENYAVSNDMPLLFFLTPLKGKIKITDLQTNLKATRINHRFDHLCSNTDVHAGLRHKKWRRIEVHVPKKKKKHKNGSRAKKPKDEDRPKFKCGVLKVLKDFEDRVMPPLFGGDATT